MLSELRSLLHAQNLDTKQISLLQEGNRNLKAYAQDILKHRFENEMGLQGLLDCFALLSSPTEDQYDRVHAALEPWKRTPSLRLPFEEIGLINGPEETLHCWNRKKNNNTKLITEFPRNRSPYLDIDYNQYEMNVEMEAFYPEDIEKLDQPYQDAARIIISPHRSALFHTRHKERLIIFVGTFSWSSEPPKSSHAKYATNLIHFINPFQVNVSHTWVFRPYII